jgi:hypothetical protein
VIKSFRVHGTIENLHEIIIFEDKKNYILESLKPQFSIDGENWTYIVESKLDSNLYKIAAIHSFTKKIEIFNKFSCSGGCDWSRNCNVKFYASISYSSKRNL